MNAQRQRPPVIDLVRMEEVEPLMATTEQLLANLEQRASDAQRTARELETQLAREGGHPETSAWMVLRLRQFVLQLCREAEDEALATVMNARRLAQDRLRPRALPLSFAGAFARRDPELAPTHLTPPVPALAWAPTPEPAPEPVAVRVAVAVAEPVPARVPEAVAPPPRLVALDVPQRAPFEQVHHVEPDEVAARFAPTDEGAADVASKMSRDFWTDEEVSNRWWRRRPRVTAATALTASAVIITALAVGIQVV